MRALLVFVVFVVGASVRPRQHPLLSLGSDRNESLANRQSFGLIDETDTKWNRRKQIHLTQMAKEEKIWDDVEANNGHTWFQYHHEPSFHCEFERRIGNTGDGGKWVCDPYKLTETASSGKPCLVYSVGSHGQFDFEESIISDVSSTCEIHIFDPEPEYQNSAPPGMHFHAYPLGAEGQVVQGVPAKTMAQIAKELGHSQRTLDLFKIDCEGCEWDTYSSWLDSGLSIRQILVELHWKNDPAQVQRFFKTLYDHGYVVFNKEPNTYGCQGECIEYAFLKLDQAFGKA